MDSVQSYLTIETLQGSYFHHFASGADEESEAMKTVYATCPKSHSYCFLIFFIIINFLLFFYIFSFCFFQTLVSRTDFQ